jgi:hypothetical protein
MPGRTMSMCRGSARAWLAPATGLSVPMHGPIGRNEPNKRAWPARSGSTEPPPKLLIRKSKSTNCRNRASRSPRRVGLWLIYAVWCPPEAANRKLCNCRRFVRRGPRAQARIAPFPACWPLMLDRKAAAPKRSSQRRSDDVFCIGSWTHARQLCRFA